MNFPGGGQKVHFLQEALAEFKENMNLIVMFTDSYDVILQKDKDSILNLYNSKFAPKIVFGAEPFCWPNASLADAYPAVGDTEKRFLNSGGFMGPAASIYALITAKPILPSDDDQLYYTHMFLDPEVQTLVGGIALDTKSEIFQNLNGASEEVMVKYDGSLGYLYNTKTDSVPAVLHGNGPSKVELSRLSNYLGMAWSPSQGCQQCMDSSSPLMELKPEEYPLVLMSVFVEEPTPFIEEFFQKLSLLTYPKQRMEVSIHCGVEYHMKHAQEFKSKHLGQYKEMYLFGTKDYATQRDARDGGISLCQARSCDFWFSIDSIAHLDNPRVLDVLVLRNRSITSPMITQVNALWATFWGALDKNGFYARSEDYTEIAQSSKRGIWNVPLVRNAYLVQRRILDAVDKPYSTVYYDDVDFDFAMRMRDKHFFMYTDNEDYFGHLIKADGFPTTHLHNDLWTIMSNPTDWAERYIHPNYSDALGPEVTLQQLRQPCPDVFWFPLVTTRFCDELVEEMEHFGKWSSGTNEDPRLEGGYENVPTRDIHMRQVDWEEHWLHFLRTYIHPLQRKAFDGYEDVPWARLNFVVRYKPDEQPLLRPHHDASSYSLNIALNTRGVDYEGGGTRFHRYNCTLPANIKGWGLMHPGRVTHLHEGLKVTNGTRYIFVTFINP
jgi:hypothetical protein